MKIVASKRRIVTKVLVNFTGIIFALLIIGPFVTEREFSPGRLLASAVLLFISLLFAILIEPAEDKKEG